MSFEEFAAARLPALLRYAVLLTGDRELARDVVQEVLVRALVKWRRVGAANDPYAYVRTMVTNEFLSRRRRKVLETVPLTFAALDGPAAPVPVDERSDLWYRLATLPKQQRAVLVLRYYEDLSDAEIADVLRCRSSTVRAYAARALATLRVELSTALPEASAARRREK
jgi:RNA polymerase sigma-70 factor (sigma-E family)